MENGLKICIDARPVQNAHRGRGIGVLLANMLAGMGELHVGDEVTLLTLQGKDLPHFFPCERQVPTRRLDRPNRFNWIADHLMLPALVGRSGAELFFATDINSYLVPRRGVKVLSMAYDLIPFIFPEVMDSQPLSVKIGWRVNFGKLRSSDAVIAISQATKDDLVRIMGVDPARIKVVYPGIDHKLFNVENAAAVEKQADLRARFNIIGRYLLYVGDSEWRKNLRRCLEAFKGADSDIKLVLVGKRAVTDAKLQGWISELGLEGRVLMPGFVPDADLPPLYGAAEAFLFPSLYEGFGLPVAEAMACGCPVITSSISSMPEVAGSAAILVDPYSVADIKSAIFRLLESHSLRRELSAAGVEQAARFSWESAAKETLAIIRGLAG
jgi:glycosyltransferase involved in cell wall biosynthesis